jgi:hypothetical protein
MNRIPRRHFLGAGSAIAAGAWLGRAWGQDTSAAPAFAAEAKFEPQSTLLTWQRDPTTTMTIQWIGTEEEGKDRPIWYAKLGSMEWKSAICEVREFPSPKYKVYRTELTGLEPGGEYSFRIGLDSKERRFRTMPTKPTNTLQFVSGGDAGAGNAARETNELAAKQDPMFVVLGGDLAYENGMIAGNFLQFLKNYSDQLIDSEGRSIPMLACLGNHEVRGGYSTSRKSAPFFYAMFDGLFADNGFGSIDFGDYMSIILLDSNHTTPIKGEQTSWLEKQLREREECPNVFVFYHVPSYPSVRPVNLDDMEKGTGSDSRKHWVPLFERFNVDAVFEHHDHAYKRTHPLLDGLVDPNGVPYLGDGSWGKLRRPVSPEDRPYLKVVDEAYHMSLHRIEGAERFHVALSDHGKVVDVCSTKKRSRMYPQFSTSL